MTEIITVHCFARELRTNQVRILKKLLLKHQRNKFLGRSRYADVRTMLNIKVKKHCVRVLNGLNWVGMEFKWINLDQEDVHWRESDERFYSQGCIIS